VFFSGGDQGRMIDALRDATVLEALRALRGQRRVRRHQRRHRLHVTDHDHGEGDFTVIDADKVDVRAGLGVPPGVGLDRTSSSASERTGCSR